MLGRWGAFWQTDLSNGADALRQAILSHLITAKHAAPHMIKKRRGLIVEVTEGDTIFGGGGNALSDVVKSSLKGFAARMAGELRTHRVAAVSITPGFLRSESMLAHFGVTEGQLARRRQEGPELPRVGVAAVRGARGRGAGGGSEGPRTLRRCPQLVGAGARATASPTTTAAGPTGESTSAASRRPSDLSSHSAGIARSLNA